MPEETTPRRKRAPAMSPDDRREAIVAATVPLLFEHGANVTTSQIAKAAGIAEGTVFRAFKDKQELIATCVRSVLDVDAELELIKAAEQADALADRLSWAISAVSGYLDRTWKLIGVLRDSGYHPHHGSGERKGPPVEMQRLSERIAGLFEPDAHRMRVDPQLAARLLLGLVFTNRMQGDGFGDSTAGTDLLVQLYLHGVLRGDQ
ncbi:TetR/AcrR family transcriptional regulator [Saccharothrix algeriensis]|uniref:AcrR family transcriptional regulator n=1 Tax=Saccharothrix algeriensis TaxID=173560 RepID=A0A8T8I2R7_9PSEU|nr:TetR/AcrR family transcriptional regulator [Saccharothrix algeriensis]MBM7811047.1 AcrR family transcriptional regulator [Saccharothrix algeriensis]QTR05007.1 TetR/AcrR family transcriptional regulator [Saccharothrix algeriensis]